MSKINPISGAYGSSNNPDQRETNEELIEKIKETIKGGLKKQGVENVQKTTRSKVCGRGTNIDFDA